MIPLVNLKEQYKQIKDEIRLVLDDVIENTAFLNGKYAKASCNPGLTGLSIFWRAHLNKHLFSRLG